MMSIALPEQLQSKLPGHPVNVRTGVNCQRDISMSRQIKYLIRRLRVSWMRVSPSRDRTIGRDHNGVLV